MVTLKLDEESIAALAEALAAKIANQEAKPMLLDVEQAATRLGVDVAWLYQRTRKNVIPHTRLGKHIKFSSEDLAKIVAMHKQGI